jgi:hypothetical protein
VSVARPSSHAGRAIAYGRIVVPDGPKGRAGIRSVIPSSCAVWRAEWTPALTAGATSEGGQASRPLSYAIALPAWEEGGRRRRADEVKPRGTQAGVRR